MPLPTSTCTHWVVSLKKCSAQTCPFMEKGECTVGGDMSKATKKRFGKVHSYGNKGDGDDET